jgi:hypothetical protein
VERMVLRHSIVLNITIVKQKKLKKRGTHSTCQRLGNSLLLFLLYSIDGVARPHNAQMESVWWAAVRLQRTWTGVDGGGRRGGRNVLRGTHAGASRLRVQIRRTGASRLFCQAGMSRAGPGTAVHCLSEHVSVYLQIGLFSEGITGDHIGITLFRGDHRGSHERFHIYRLTYQPGQRGSHQSSL